MLFIYIFYAHYKLTKVLFYLNTMKNIIHNSGLKIVKLGYNAINDI